MEADKFLQTLITPVDKLIIEPRPLIQTIPLDSRFYLSPYNAKRRAKLILFSSCLSEYEEYLNKTKKEQQDLIQKIERSCFNYMIDASYKENIVASWSNTLFCDGYHAVCYKISSNLERTGLIGNSEFALRILNGEIDIKILPRMASHEIHPELYSQIFKRVEAGKNVKQTIKTSSIYKCRRCHQRQCQLTNLYNRSLDEGINISVRCMNCDYSFNA